MNETSMKRYALPTASTHATPPTAPKLAPTTHLQIRHLPAQLLLDGGVRRRQLIHAALLLLRLAPRRRRCVGGGRQLAPQPLGFRLQLRLACAQRLARHLLLCKLLAQPWQRLCLCRFGLRGAQLRPRVAQLPLGLRAAAGLRLCPPAGLAQLLLQLRGREFARGAGIE